MSGNARGPRLFHMLLLSKAAEKLVTNGDGKQRTGDRHSGSNGWRKFSGNCSAHGSVINNGCCMCRGGNRSTNCGTKSYYGILVIVGNFFEGTIETFYTVHWMFSFFEFFWS